jgi:hypothetical protein
MGRFSIRKRRLAELAERRDVDAEQSSLVSRIAQATLRVVYPRCKLLHNDAL